MQIPVKFKIRNVAYTVQPFTCYGRVQGTFIPACRHLWVATQHKGKARKSQDIAETFWHEVTHAILRDMDHPQWDDETFVTAFSKRLTQVIYTARFE